MYACTDTDIWLRRGTSTTPHSIHRCYKLQRDGAERGAYRGNFRGIGVRLCRILDMNFREYLFHDVG